MFPLCPDSSDVIAEHFLPELFPDAAFRTGDAILFPAFLKFEKIDILRKFQFYLFFRHGLPVCFSLSLQIFRLFLSLKLQILENSFIFTFSIKNHELDSSWFHSLKRNFEIYNFLNVKNWNLNVTTEKRVEKNYNVKKENLKPTSSLSTSSSSLIALFPSWSTLSSSKNCSMLSTSWFRLRFLIKSTFHRILFHSSCVILSRRWERSNVVQCRRWFLEGNWNFKLK